jgi:ergothioneine biosynthesis protein EgtB
MSDTSAGHINLSAEFDDALNWAERMFNMLQPQAWFARPISLRHPSIFYLGHLPAFAWNKIFAQCLQRNSYNERFDRLFERGIDPLDVGDSPALITDWPPLVDIIAYRTKIEKELRCLVEQIDKDAGCNSQLRQAAEMVLEHYWMHVETFFYMQHQLDPALKREIALPDSVSPLTATKIVKRVSIPDGVAVLGSRRSRQFGWCNEFEETIVPVDEFAIDCYPVTNGEFLEFVESGAYRRRELWSDEDWSWLSKRGHTCPVFWKYDGGKWWFRAMFEWMPLHLDWPAWVSKVEADAFAKWKKADLPTEAEFHRAAYGTADGDRLYPWGNEDAAAAGNLGLQRFSPEPVGSRPETGSRFGVHELVGNGWEWTSTPFSPFPGFRTLPSYPGYSTDFFDGRHFVLKGGSPLTARRLTRRSFRNWYQAHYPYVYAKFRCVYRNRDYA